VEVRYRPNLRDTAGHAAHAATFIRDRVIVLDLDLKHDQRERERILLHELFHFVWVRLGNPRRRGWEVLLRAEWESRARGEAGWSSEWRKRLLSSRDVAGRSRGWREYCCESFCDTGAFAAGANDGEVTLNRKRLAARVAWFVSVFGGEAFLI
jgi:hypothetical protein